MTIDDYTSGDPEFTAWLKRVDALCIRRVGVSILDLPDACWADMFEDGLRPGQALASVLDEEGI